MVPMAFTVVTFPALSFVECATQSTQKSIAIGDPS
jgi:hypothetical protein